MKSADNPAPAPAQTLNRRSLLGLAGAAALSLVPQRAFAYGQALAKPRALAFYNLHTGEKLRTEFWAEGKFIPEALGHINRLLRDHRTNEISAIDPTLLDLLHRLQRRIGTEEAFHVISGYRSPASNSLLRARSGGVANRSLHMSGKAIDIALPGCKLAHLRQAALDLRAGGVGYYPASGFVHVDTGRVRQWT